MAQLSPQRRRAVAPVLLGLVLLLAWALAAAAASPVLLPGPGRVLARFWTDLTTGALWPYLAVTLAEALAGRAACEVRNGASASGVTTQGEMVVRKLLPRNGCTAAENQTERWIATARGRATTAPSRQPASASARVTAR